MTALRSHRLPLAPGLLAAAAPVLLLLALLGLGTLSVAHHAATAKASEPQPAQPDAAAPLISVVAVGDVMLDRGPGAKIRRGGPEVIFARVLSLLEDADLRFCNLECPLSATGPHDVASLVFRADPGAVEALVHGGFQVVSLANNHTFNAGREGLYNTIDTLRAKGIAYVGAHGRNEAEASCASFDVKGLKVGFLAYTQFRPTHALLSRQTLTKVCGQVRQAAGRHDLLFVSVHWGEEYRRSPTAEQVAFGHALVDAGADVVLGHHPHILEGVEVYKGGVICYSLGNCVFDQRDVEPMESAVFRFNYRPGVGLQLRLTPVWIPRATFAPEPCQNEKADKILTRLEKLCGGLGTQLLVSDDQAMVTVYAARSGETTDATGGAAGGEQGVRPGP